MGVPPSAAFDVAYAEPANGCTREPAIEVTFDTDPSRYRHWKLTAEGDIATLLMDVDEKGALFEGYELKLNSYDLGVDIELADVARRAAGLDDDDRLRAARRWHR